MRRYLIILAIVTAVMVAAGVALGSLLPGLTTVTMVWVPLYFAVVTGALHFVVTSAAHKDPRRFVRTFLASTMASLLVHLGVLSAYMFTHVAAARQFAIVFAVGYVVYLVFETVALVTYVKHYQKGSK